MVRSMGQLFSRLLYLGFFSWFCWIGPSHSIANYDMFPYVGAVLSYSSEGGSLRERALADVRKYVSEEQFKSFTSGSTYIETVARDDQAFREQLPGYLVKPLYVLLTKVVATATGNIAHASVVMSSIGFLLMGFALYCLRPKGGLEPAYLLTVILFLFLGNPPLLLFSRVSTPDSLAIGLTLLGFWALLRSSSSYLPVVYFSLAVLARPDSIVTFACLLPFIAKRHFDLRAAGKSLGTLAAAVAVPFLVYIGSSLLFPSFSLMQLIVFMAKGPFPYLSSIDTSNFFDIYKSALYSDLISLFALPRFVAFVLLNLALLVLLSDWQMKLVLLAGFGNIFLKIVLFPNFDGGLGERFFCTSYFLVIYVIFTETDRRFNHMNG